MRVRPTVRVLLLDPAHRLFLFPYEDAVALDPATPDLRISWVTPDGALSRAQMLPKPGCANTGKRPASTCPPFARASGSVAGF